MPPTAAIIGNNACFLFDNRVAGKPRPKQIGNEGVHSIKVANKNDRPTNRIRRPPKCSRMLLAMAAPKLSPVAAAPKATPIAKPSGIFCKVIDEIRSILLCHVVLTPSTSSGGAPG